MKINKDEFIKLLTEFEGDVVEINLVDLDNVPVSIETNKTTVKHTAKFEVIVSKEFDVAL